MPEASGLLRGKRGLIMGVANNRSLAWTHSNGGSSHSRRKSAGC
jgi:enoyl-[acyl-carrier-protein] reductase (NADH)